MGKVEDRGRERKAKRGNGEEEREGGRETRPPN